MLFAQSPAVLGATFGLTPPKPRVVPVATKAKASSSQGAAGRKAKEINAVAAVDAGTPAPAATPAAQPAATPVAAQAVKPAS